MPPNLLKEAAQLNDMARYQALHKTYTFAEYLDLVRQKPEITRNAFQRLYDMILREGSEEYVDNKKTITSYRFFSDPHKNGANAIFGIDIALMRLVNVFRSAALAFGSQKRIILMVGPVATSKSTISLLLKQGLERYSYTDEGALYTFEWYGLKQFDLNGDEDVFASQMHEEVLKIIPSDWREKAIETLKLSNDNHKVVVKGELDPASRFMMKELLARYDGDWEKVVENHVRVKRLTLSEKNRVGIGTYLPRDSKSLDASDLTGDINYRKIAVYGSDSDPRAFNFDGEFCVANRGILEMIEVLKLDTEFLYDLLEATAGHSVKPKKFAQTDIDEVIIGHTNMAEYVKLLQNPFMEALRDRTIKVEIPYVTKLQEEMKIYKKDFNSDKIKGIHIAPHCVEIASIWAVLTRLSDPKKHNLNLMQKLKLYSGRSVPGFTADTIKELRKESNGEGLSGISPRYIQDKLSAALVDGTQEGMVNPFMILNQLEKGLLHHSLLNSEEDRQRYKELIGLTKREYEEIVKNEVQRAISSDEEAISKLCGNYIDNIKAYTLKERIKNKYTGQDEEADERLMRSIEEKIEIPDNRKDDFRREIMNFIGGLAIDGKKFEWGTNDRLRRALEMKLFEDQKDTIKLKSLVSAVVDKETQEKIDVIKARLIKNFGYNEASATDVLNYVASIFARGDTKD